VPQLVRERWMRGANEPCVSVMRGTVQELKGGRAPLGTHTRAERGCSHVRVSNKLRNGDHCIVTETIVRTGSSRAPLSLSGVFGFLTARAGRPAAAPRARARAVPFHRASVKPYLIR